MFVLVFVSRDFEVGRNVSCEESTVSLIFHGLCAITRCFFDDVRVWRWNTALVTRPTASVLYCIVVQVYNGCCG